MSITFDSKLFPYSPYGHQIFIRFYITSIKRRHQVQTFIIAFQNVMLTISQLYFVLSVIHDGNEILWHNQISENYNYSIKLPAQTFFWCFLLNTFVPDLSCKTMYWNLAKQVMPVTRTTISIKEHF